MKDSHDHLFVLTVLPVPAHMEKAAETCAGYGYELVEIPRLPVEERVRFVIASVSGGASHPSRS